MYVINTQNMISIDQNQMNTATKTVQVMVNIQNTMKMVNLRVKKNTNQGKKMENKFITMKMVK